MTDETPADPPRSVPLRAQLLSTMRVVAEGIRIDGLMADQLAQISERARTCGETEMADGLLDIVRGHRVSVLEAQSRLVVLQTRYAALFSDEP